MNFTLSTAQADELAELLHQTLGDLSCEIAATDNPFFRADLMARRARLADIDGMVRRLLLVPPVFDDGGPLVRELAWPGD